MKETTCPKCGGSGEYEFLDIVYETFVRANCDCKNGFQAPLYRSPKDKSKLYKANKKALAAAIKAVENVS